MTTLAPTAPRAARALAALRGRTTTDAVVGASLGAALSLLAFVTTGGVDLGPNTWAEIVLTLIGAALGGAVVVRSAPGRRWGGATLLLFVALTVVTIVSISWSLQPSD
jgi:hypothetical protein